MKEVMVFIVLAVISYLFRRLFIWMSKDDFAEAEESTGLITKITHSQYGNTKYYVSFFNNEGIQVEGASVYYSSTKGKYKVNESVKFQYLVIENGYCQVVLIDDELIPCSTAMVSATRNMLIASIVFIVLAIGFYVKNVLI